MRRLAIVVLLLSCAPRAHPPLNDGVLRVAILGDSVAHGAGDESGRGIAGHLDASTARGRQTSSASCETRRRAQRSPPAMPW